MNAGYVEVDGALDNPTEFLCFGMERKHLTEILELKGPSDRSEGTFSSNLQKPMTQTYVTYDSRTRFPPTFNQYLCSLLLLALKFKHNLDRRKEPKLCD